MAESSASDHNAVVRSQFALQARPFTTALHANDPGMLGQYLRMIPLPAGARVVDFCSGPGIVASHLEPRASRVVCLDVTHEMLLEARARAPRSLLAEGHAGRAPLHAGSFDAAVTRLSLHHVERPEEVVREMARVVKPGGLVVLNDIVTSEDDEESAYTEKIERLRDPSHTRCLKPSALANLPARCGLEPLAVEHYVSTLDHDEWMTRVFPPEENRPVVRRMLEAITGRDMGGMSVAVEGGVILISRRGLIVSARVS